MNDNERDTHFLGFAKLLIEKLDSIHALRIDIVLDEIEPLISQCAYDLACHVTQQCFPNSKDIPGEVNSMEDLTEWSKPHQP